MTSADLDGPQKPDPAPRRKGLSGWFNRTVMRRDRGPSIVRNGRRYLRDIYAASHQAGVTPFLMWGTLLGCVRENGLLAHDYDVDVGLRAGDYARKDALIAAMRWRGYRATWDTRYKIRFIHRLHTLHIDVDVFYPWEDKVVCAAIQPNGDVVGEVFEPDMFDHLKEIDFLDGLRVFIPDPPERVLATIYGEWQVPNPGYRSGTDLLNRLVLEPGAPIPPLLPGLRAGF